MPQTAHKHDHKFQVPSKALCGFYRQGEREQGLDHHRLTTKDFGKVFASSLNNSAGSTTNLDCVEGFERKAVRLYTYPVCQKPPAHGPSTPLASW